MSFVHGMELTMKIYLNGEYVEKEDAKVSVFDHGLLYGDGVFEGIRLYDGCVFKLEEHLERLEYSAKAILLDLPLTRDEFREAVWRTCRRNQLTTVVRLSSREVWSPELTGRVWACERHHHCRLDSTVSEESTRTDSKSSFPLQDQPPLCPLP